MMGMNDDLKRPKVIEEQKGVQYICPRKHLLFLAYKLRET